MRFVVPCYSDFMLRILVIFLLLELKNLIFFDLVLYRLFGRDPLTAPKAFYFLNEVSHFIGLIFYQKDLMAFPNFVSLYHFMFQFDGHFGFLHSFENSQYLFFLTDYLYSDISHHHSWPQIWNALSDISSFVIHNLR